MKHKKHKKEKSEAKHTEKHAEKNKTDEFSQNYKVEADGITANIKISGENGKPRYYHVSFDEASEAVKALLDKIRHKLITEVNVTTNEILDPKSINELKKRFIKRSKEFLSSELSHIESATEKFLIGTMIQDMLGLGKVEYLINDPDIEEIVINRSDEQVRIYHKIYGR